MKYATAGQIARNGRVAAGAAAVALVAAGAWGTAATPSPAIAADAAPSADQFVDVEGIRAVTVLVEADAAKGTFAWEQGVPASNAAIRDGFAPATATLCGATSSLIATNPLQWELKVSGDVEHEFTATVDVMAADESVQQTMTCTCGGNPADGRAIFDVEVKGIPITYLLGESQPADEVNTVTFVCSDGTEVAMPLAYAVGRHAVISYEVNGEDLSASVGGNNQLWLAGTSANYFARDIVEVVFSIEDESPANPGEGVEYPNSPNVGIVGSSVSA